MFDTNHDGTITSQKLGELMRKLGQNPTDQDLIQMIEAVSKPGSKKIGFDEFVDMMERKNNEEDTEVEIINAFRVFDTESNCQPHIGDNTKINALIMFKAFTTYLLIFFTLFIIPPILPSLCPAIPC